MFGRPLLVSTACALALLGGGEIGRSVDASYVRADGCHEIVAFIDVPSEAEHVVRARVPSRFELYRTPYGSAQLSIVSRRCNTLGVAGGEARTTTEARLTAVVAPPPGSEATCPVCNWYLLFWVTDNQEFNAWLKEGAGLGEDKVRHVRDLRHSFAPRLFPSENFASGAPKPTPSPFDVAARAADPELQPAGVPFVAHVWASGDRRTAKFTARLDSIRFASAVGEVRPEPGSEMHRMLGGADRSFESPAASNGWDGIWIRELCDDGWACTRR